MFGLHEATMNTIIKEISQFDQIQQAMIFGSRAKGNFKAGSDIDIAVKGSNLEDNTIIKLSRRLNQEVPIPHFIDVVHYNSITNQDLIEHINRIGKIIYYKPGTN